MDKRTIGMSEAIMPGKQTKRKIDKSRIAVYNRIGNPERIAVYIRAAVGDSLQTTSFDIQKEYYSDLYGSKEGVEFVGIYADVGSGTNIDRPEFQRLLADCRAGKIDKIATKSISRFSRNLVSLTDTVNELRRLGVSILFEVERIDTSVNEDILLQMITTLAEEESAMRSAMMTQSWARRKGKAKTIKSGGR